MIRSFRIAARLCPLVLLFGGGVAFADTNGRLDSPVSPTFEAVYLDLDATGDDYTGSVRIEVHVAEPTRDFEFHAEEMTIESARLTGADGKPVSLECELRDGGFVTARAVADIVPGDYALEISFARAYDTQAVGLYRVTQGGIGYLFTQFEDVDARKAFPCWDEPIYKIEWQMTIRIPEDQEIVTNTPVASETRAEGHKTVVFERTPPMPSYLLAIAAGPLESVEITGMSVPGRIYCTQGQKHLTELAAQVAPRALGALEKWFGRAYPYKKLDLIAIPEYWPGAMENPGAVTYKDQLLLLDSQTASVSQRRSLVRVTTHEFAHMWFGDLVTMSWWDDLWLNESFADWLGDKVASGLYPEYNIEVNEVQGAQNVMAGDARPSSSAIRKPVDSRDDIGEDIMLAYEKGKTILHMVEAWVGEDAFRRGVLDYINRHAWGNTVARDLFDSVSNASDIDISPVLASFLDQPGFPLVTAEVSGTGVVTLSQKRFVNFGVDAQPQTWVVPVQLKYSDGEGVYTRTVLLKDESTQVELGTRIEWMHPNAGSCGYYRWVVPAPMMYKMAENPELLDARERATFLSNADALLEAGSFSGDEYLAVLTAFAQSPEPEAVSAVVSSLNSVENAFVTEELEAPFAVYVRQTLAPAMERIGMDPVPGESEVVSLLRPQLLAWLGTRGHDEDVQAHCVQLAAKSIADPASVDAQIAGVALRVAAHDGDRKLFDTYCAQFEAASEPAIRQRYLGAIGSFTNPELQDLALEYALGGQVRINEMFGVFAPIMGTPAGRDRVYNWFTTNYDKIKKRMPPMFVAYMPFIASGCSTERLAAAREFFSAPEHSVPGTDKTLAKVTDQVTDCVNLREREGAAVAEYLNGMVSTQ